MRRAVRFALIYRSWFRNFLFQRIGSISDSVNTMSSATWPLFGLFVHVAQFRPLNRQLFAQAKQDRLGVRMAG